MSIRWITPQLGTAPAEEVVARADISVIDVRNLVDKGGNDLGEIRTHVDKALQSLRRGRLTVIACDYGISRSNAVACGVLSAFAGIPFSAAVRKVMEATGETEIKSAPLDAVRRAMASGGATAAGSSGVVLLTGAGGALGPAVAKALRGDFQVLTPARAELDLESGTTALDLFVEENNVGGIVHLASPRIFTSNIALGRTLTMLRNVLDVCVTRDIGLLYPSGWEIYSGYTGTILANEAMPAFPAGPYGETKHLAEIMIDHWRKTTPLRCSIVRASPVYGPGLPKPKFIHNFIGKARRNETILTHRYLDGDPALDLLHIDDFADALARVVRFAGEIDVNIGTGNLISTPAVADLVREFVGGTGAIGHTDVDSRTSCVAMDSRRARQRLGWSATTDIRAGLKQIIDNHFRESEP